HVAQPEREQCDQEHDDADERHLEPGRDRVEPFPEHRRQLRSFGLTGQGPGFRRTRSMMVSGDGVVPRRACGWKSYSAKKPFHISSDRSGSTTSDGLGYPVQSTSPGYACPAAGWGIG